VCAGWSDLARELECARGAHLVAKCSGIGGWDSELAEAVLDLQSPATRVVFWDVDAPQTLASARAEPVDTPGTFRALIPRYDAILLYGGGPPVEAAYAQLGARRTQLVYNAVDPAEYYPVPPDPARACDLLFMANRMPDREQRVAELFFAAARAAPELAFVLGGNGWGDCQLPANVRWIGHVPTGEHRVWNSSARLVLNINRADMAAIGYSPPTRVFEAAGCGSCIVTDAWQGIEMFLSPGHEILVASTAADVVAHLRQTSPARASAIGAAARSRVLRDHTYAARAADLDAALAHLFSPQADASHSPGAQVRASAGCSRREAPSAGTVSA
jgi:spore maturation protein CgeB